MAQAGPTLLSLPLINIGVAKEYEQKSLQRSSVPKISTENRFTMFKARNNRHNTPVSRVNDSVAYDDRIPELLDAPTK